MAQFTTTTTNSFTNYNLDSQTGLTDPHIFNIDSGVTVTITGTLSGAARLIKQGTGTLDLSGATLSSTGGVQLEAGTINMGANHFPAPADLDADYWDLRGGTIDATGYTGSNTFVNGVNQGVTITGDFTLNGPSTTELSQSAIGNTRNNITSPIVINGSGRLTLEAITDSHSILTVSGGITGDASGDTAGIRLLNNESRYPHLNVRSNINLPDAAIDFNNDATYGGSIYQLNESTEVTVNRFIGHGWIDNAGSNTQVLRAENTIAGDGSTNTFRARQIELTSDTTHLYFGTDLTTSFNPWLAGSQGANTITATTEFGGSFVYRDSLIPASGATTFNIAGGTSNLFVGGEIVAGHINTNDWAGIGGAGNPTFKYAISQESVGKITIRSDVGSPFPGAAIFGGTIELVPTEQMSYFTGGDIFDDLNGLEGSGTALSYTHTAANDPNGFINDAVTFSSSLSGGTFILASSLPTVAPYILTPSATEINEGQSVTFTLTTDGIADGTVVNYTTDGIVASDLDTGSAALSGTLTTNATTPPTITYNLAVDSIVDTDTITVNIIENETFDLGFRKVGSTTFTPGVATSTEFFLTTVDGVTATFANDNELLSLLNENTIGTFGTHSLSFANVQVINLESFFNHFRADVTFAGDGGDISIPAFSDAVTATTLIPGTTPVASASTVVNDVLPNIQGTTTTAGMVGSTSVTISGIAPTIDLSAEFGTFGSILIGTASYEYDVTPVRNADDTVTVTISPATVAWDIGDHFEVDANTPVYRLIFDQTSINEGGTITATLNTRNVADGTILPFTLSDANQFFNLGTQQFEVSTNTATFEFTPLLDGVERTSTAQIVTLTLTANNEDYTFTVNNFSTPDNTGATIGRSADVVFGYLQNDVVSDSPTVDIYFANQLADTAADFFDIVPQTGTLTIGRGDVITTATYTGVEEAYEDSGGSGSARGSWIHEGRIRFTGVSGFNINVLALYGNNVGDQSDFSSIRSGTMIQVSANAGTGGHIPYGRAAESVSSLGTIETNNPGRNIVDIMFPEGSYSMESGHRNIPQQGRMQVWDSTNEALYTLNYESWDNVSYWQGIADGDGRYLTGGQFFPRNSFPLYARRFRLSSLMYTDQNGVEQAITNSTWAAVSWFSFPDAYATPINNVIVNGTNNGDADFEISGVQLESGDVYTLNSSTSIEDNIDVSDVVTFNYTENDLEYSIQSTVESINTNNNTINVNLGGQSIGTNDISIAGFADDDMNSTHAHLNGLYQPTTNIPTFTGFDPDGSENTPVVGSTVYVRTVGSLSFYIWNRADTTTTQGGWHISSATAGDNTVMTNPLNWAYLSVANPQEANVINSENWIEASGVAGSHTNTTNTNVSSIFVNVNDVTDGELYINKISEGDSVTFTIHTQGVEDGGSLPYNISGNASLLPSDFVDSENNALTSLLGEFEVINNMGTVTLTVNPDGTTEGIENVTFNVGNNSSDISINASTGDEVFTLTAVDSSGAAITEINEGETAVVRLRTTNVPNRAVINYNVTGITTDDLDAGSSSLSGNFTVRNNGVGIDTINIGTRGVSYNNTSQLFVNYGEQADGTPIDATFISTYLSGATTGSIRLGNEGPWLPFTNYRADNAQDISRGDLRFDIALQYLSIAQTSRNNDLVQLSRTVATDYGFCQGYGSSSGDEILNGWLDRSIYINVGTSDDAAKDNIITQIRNGSGLWIYPTDTNDGGPYFVNVVNAYRFIGSEIEVAVDRSVPLNSDGDPIRFVGDANNANVIAAQPNNLDLIFNLTADASETANENITISVNNNSSSISLDINNTSPEPVYSLTATGTDADGSALTGNSFAVTEGGSVTYSLRSNNNNPVLLGDNVSYDIASEIDNTDLAPNSNKLRGSFYLDNGGLGFNNNFTWTRVGIFERFNGENLFMNWAPGETAADIRAAADRFGGSDSDPDNRDYRGLVRINGGVPITFEFLDTTRTGSEDFLIRMRLQGVNGTNTSFRQQQIAGHINELNTDSIVEITSYYPPTFDSGEEGAFGVIGQVQRNQTHSNGVVTRGWVGNEITINAGSRTWSIPSSGDRGVNNRNQVAGLINVVNANPHVWVWPNNDRPSESAYPDSTYPDFVNYNNGPIAVTLSFNRIVNLGTDSDTIVFNTNIPYPYSDTDSAAFTNDGRVFPRISSPATDLTFNFNTDSTFEGYENINLVLPNHSDVSVPNIRVRDDGAVFDFTELNDNNAADNRQSVNEGDNITFGIEIEDANDVEVDALSYKLVDTNGSLITDTRVTQTGNITLTDNGDGTKSGSVSIPTINTFGIEDTLDLNLEVQWTVGGNTFTVETLYFDLLDIINDDDTDHDIDPDTHGTGDYMLPVPAGETRTVNANISGTRRLVKTGDGTLVLNGDNTNTQGIEIQAGCVEISNNNSLGTQPIFLVNNYVTMTNDTCLINNSGRKIVFNENSGFVIGNGGSGDPHIQYIEPNNGTIEIQAPITRTRDTDMVVIRSNTSGVVKLRSNLSGISDLTPHTFDIQVMRNTTLDINDRVAPFNNVVHAGNIMSDGDVRGRGKVNGNVIFNSNGRFLPGSQVSTTLHIGGNLELVPSSITYISITRDGNDACIVDGDVILDGKLLLIPFEDNLPVGSRDVITLTNAASQIANNGWSGSNIINYRDQFDNNGINLDNDSDYPTVDIVEGNQSDGAIVRLVRL